MSDEKLYDLEERMLAWALRVRAWIKQLPRGVCNIEDGRQLVRASASVGANYIEANEHLSKKDFIHRAKISRREAKESRFFLRLIDVGGSESLEEQRKALVQEATELIHILSAIMRKFE